MNTEAPTVAREAAPGALRTLPWNAWRDFLLRTGDLPALAHGAVARAVALLEPNADQADRLADTFATETAASSRSAIALAIRFAAAAVDRDDAFAVNGLALGTLSLVGAVALEEDASPNSSGDGFLADLPRDDLFAAEAAAMVEVVAELPCLVPGLGRRLHDVRLGLGPEDRATWGRVLRGLGRRVARLEHGVLDLDGRGRLVLGSRALYYTRTRSGKQGERIVRVPLTARSLPGRLILALAAGERPPLADHSVTSNARAALRRRGVVLVATASGLALTPRPRLSPRARQALGEHLATVT
jgi:hypothetical protein